MKNLTDSSFDESTNSEVMTPAATGVSYIETVVSSTLPSVQPVESGYQQPCPIPNMETQINWWCRVEKWLDKKIGPRDDRSTGHVNPGLTVTAVRPKRRSLQWSWANDLLRCYRHRRLSIEFVTFYKGFLGTGFQTSLQALKVHGVCPSPPTYVLHLCSTITCTLRHFVRQTHCPNLFTVTFFLRSPVRHLLSPCLLPWGLISAFISCTVCRWLLFCETLWKCVFARFPYSRVRLN